MSDAAPATTELTPTEARAERQAAMLAELAEVGLRLARKLPELAERADADPQALDLAFTRISRAIRLSLHMENQVIEDAADAKALAAQRAAEAAAHPAPIPPRPPAWEIAGLSKADYDETQRIARRRDGARAMLNKAVERVDSERLQDRLACELMERFDEGRDEAAFASTAPLAEVIAQICRDLAFDPAWRDLRPKDFHDVDQATALALKHGRYRRPPPDIPPDPPPDPAPSLPPSSAEAEASTNEGLPSVALAKEGPVYPTYTPTGIRIDIIPPERPPRPPGSWMA